MREIIVENKFNNKKLQNVLMANFNGLTSSIFFKALRKKNIKLNGKRISENVNVYTNDVINIFLNDNFLFKTFKLNIVYDDENILIVDKPRELEVLTSDNSNPTLTSLIQKHFNLNNNFPYPCHRLDRNTSGLVIYAKNKDTLDFLNNKIKNHEITKLYKCTVIGTFKKKEETLKAFLFKDIKKSTVYISPTFKKGYKEIVTSYKVLKEDKNNNLSTLEVQLHTGRTHQIRAHLAYINHPILGDGKYGNNEINKKFRKHMQELCAYKLIFNFKNENGSFEYLNGKEFFLR